MNRCAPGHRSTGRRSVDPSEHRRALDAVAELQDRLDRHHRRHHRRILAAWSAGLIIGGAVPSLALLAAVLTL